MKSKPLKEVYELEKLAPCGCGGEAEFKQYASGPCVRCTRCGTTTTNHLTRANAAAAWNKAMRKGIK